jgi:UDP-N-acetylglucosamine 2-epimerase (non-hydrolysing)
VSGPRTAGRTRLKVMTIVGTRPEVVKMSRVLAELDAHTDHVLVHTGQNADYELNQVFFEQLRLRAPDHVLDVAGDTVAETIGRIIARCDGVMAAERPDAVVLYGDTNTCLAVIAAKRRQIPVFHLEAGNRSFDERVPEEINRRLVDHLADINLPLTEHARRYLLAEGIRPETVIKIGSPMREVLEHYRPGIESSRALEELNLRPGEYFLVSAHREENVDPPERLALLLATLNALVGRHGQRVIVSTHPRTRQRLEAVGEKAQGRDPRIEFLKPFGFLDYVRLEMHATAVLSDSGTLTEESAILGFPAVMLRDAHERPEGMDEGVAVMAGLGAERVLQAVELVRAHVAGRPRPRPVPDYAGLDVSKTVVRIVLSYTDYVNRVVWRRGT